MSENIYKTPPDLLYYVDGRPVQPNPLARQKAVVKHEKSLTVTGEVETILLRLRTLRFVLLTDSDPGVLVAAMSSSKFFLLVLGVREYGEMEKILRETVSALNHTAQFVPKEASQVVARIQHIWDKIDWDTSTAK